MERESFENEEVAQLLNDHFISIKVDREERPDVDHIYMTFCQMLTGSGGWPLTIIMTPDQKPFYAGTYFPKRSLMDILNQVHQIWTRDKGKLLEAGEELYASIGQSLDTESEGEGLPVHLVKDAASMLEGSFDAVYGGFGRAPKFPSPHQLLLLLRVWKQSGEDRVLDIVEKTLTGMYRGGIFDHVGGGFSRYSTDAKWLVPHFEKMLYDNALLAMAYLETFQATGNDLYAHVAERIFMYVLRDMTSPEGAFYSAEDADSEGEEGAFYVWTPAQVEAELGEEEGKRFCLYYGITAKGNFEGKSIPNLIHMKDALTTDTDVAAMRQKIFAEREKRVHPFKDDKIIVSWNGLMIAALAMGGKVLGKKEYTAAAARAVQCILEHMVRDDGRLMSTFRQGKIGNLGYVDDYAFLTWGLLELYDHTQQAEWLKKALGLTGQMLELFGDENTGGLYLYGKDAESLIHRPKEIYDGAVPSGNSAAAVNLIRLSRLTGDESWNNRALTLLRAFAGTAEGYPAGYAYYLTGVWLAEQAPSEVVVVSNRSAGEEPMLQQVQKRYLPGVTVLYRDVRQSEELDALSELVQGREMINGKATAYVCRNRTCNAPVTEAEALQELLDTL